MKNLDLKRAIDIVRGGDWLHLRYITADVAKAKGGTVIEYIKCRSSRKDKPTLSNAISKGKPQNHSDHFTINVELPNGHLRKVHLILITHINQTPIL